MVKVIWNDVVLAESSDTVIVDRKHYFKVEDVKMEYLLDSDKYTICDWKGIANYYSIKANGKKNIDSVWYYANPKEKAMNIKGRIAFSYIHGVDVVQD